MNMKKTKVIEYDPDYPVSVGGTPSGGVGDFATDRLRDSSAFKSTYNKFTFPFYGGSDFGIDYWSNPWVNPKSAYDFDGMYSGGTMEKSVVHFDHTITDKSIADGVEISFDCDPAGVKYLASPHVMARYFCDGNLYAVPLIIQVTEYDSVSRKIKGVPITGLYNEESGTYSIEYPVVRYLLDKELESSKVVYHENFLIALSGVPDLTSISSNSQSDLFVLQVDCPAIRPDAKKGDVFVFGQSNYSASVIEPHENVDVLCSWIKMYSMREKLDFMRSIQGKTVNITMDGEVFSCSPIVFGGDKELALHRAKRESRYVAKCQSEVSSGLNQCVLPVADEDKEHFHKYDTVVVEVELYDSDMRHSTDSRLLMIVTGFDSSTNNPVVMAVNGLKNLPDDELSVIPKIPAGTKITIIDDGLKLNPSIALMLNDLKLESSIWTGETPVNTYKSGELYIIIDKIVVPMDFDSLVRLATEQDLV